MLQVSVLRNDPQWAKERLILKGFSQPELVDTIISLDDQRKKTQNEFDHNQSQVNQASKQIGGLMAKGQTQEAETLKATVAELKTTLDPLKESMQQIEKQLVGLFGIRCYCEQEDDANPVVHRSQIRQLM